VLLDDREQVRQQVLLELRQVRRDPAGSRVRRGAVHRRVRGDRDGAAARRAAGDRRLLLVAV